MSHLSTIIERVNKRSFFHTAKQSDKTASYDALFEQAVINLMEYADNADDITPDELGEALRLYDSHRKSINGQGMPSHKERLAQADKIRDKIMNESR